MLAGPWFHAITGQGRPAFEDAQQYRQRHLIKALARKTSP
jgi:hypothetical protein